jgi:spore coat polysaccharide biosynthesis protein SpsF (cytidylyltransferase family)
LQCANHFGFTHIIPIDGDDIYVSELALNTIMNQISLNNVAKTTNMPLGLNLMSYAVSELRNVMINNETLKYTTGWDRIFTNVIDLTVDIKNNELIHDEHMKLLRFTLDYQDDLDFFASIINNSDVDFISISTIELLQFVLKQKKYLINFNIKDIYWNNFNKEKQNEIMKNSI